MESKNRRYFLQTSTAAAAAALAPRMSAAARKLDANDRVRVAVVGVRGAWRQLNYDIFVGRPISRPASFTTASPVAGFSLHASF